MRAAVLRTLGAVDGLDLVDMPAPEPEADEVLLRVLACGVNRGLDARTRANGAGRQLDLPLILGTEIVGEIVGLGASVSGWSTGARVLVVPWVGCGSCRECREGAENACSARQFFGLNRPGGNAEFVAVPAGSIVEIPEADRPLEECAALPVSYTTAFHMLHARARLESGETLVVLGAAGAVGRAALEIGKAMGARVIAVVSSEAKAQTLPASVDEVLTSYEHLAERVLALTGGRGAEAIVDHVGADTVQQSLDALGPNGRLAICGASSGHDLSFDARPLWRKCVSIFFSNSGTRADVERVLAMWGAGKFDPMPLTVLPLEELRAAHEQVERRDFVGKLVIKPGRAERALGH